MLKLAEKLGNVSKACQIMGYHHDTLYEVKRASQMGGVAGLVEQRRGPKGPHPNRVAPEVEQKVLDYCLEKPTHGPQRIANELQLLGIDYKPHRSSWRAPKTQRGDRHVLPSSFAKVYTSKNVDHGLRPSL